MQSPKQIVYLDYIENGLAVLHLGAPQEAELSFSLERLTSLYEAIEDCKKNKPRALIVAGPHEEMFSTGWDTAILETLADEHYAKQFSKDGQELCAGLQSLPCLTVCAISGPCLGLACEIALACRIRLISDHFSSVIGLTQVREGVLPCFGGTQRLVRLVGPMKGAELIAKGNSLHPLDAAECGLVHEVVTSAKLMPRAEMVALRKERIRKPVRPPLKERLFIGTAAGQAKLKAAAVRAIPENLRKSYPALDGAISAVFTGLQKSEAAGLSEETAQFSRLLFTPESKSLLRLARLARSAQALGGLAKRHVERLNAVVVGAGRMGSSIAALLAHHGCQVILKDTTEEALKSGHSVINTYLNRCSYLTEKEKRFILNRIETTTHDIPNTNNTSLAIEAIYDDLAVKKKLIAELSRTLPHDAVLATSTSSFSISQLVEGAQNPERVIGLHLFNGSGKTSLVEIARSSKTSDRAIAIGASLAVKLGKVPVIVEDGPGFLVNRILYPALSETLQLLQEGCAAKEIEDEMIAFGMPLGPFKLMDEVGLDIVAKVLPRVEPAGPELEAKIDTLKTLINRGRKGRKSGVGFYDYSSQPVKFASDLSALLSPKISKTKSERAVSLADRCIFRMINEAVACLDRGVAGKPGPEAASQIDLASVLGAAFPAFRGGVLYYADTLGAKNVLDKCRELEKHLGPRFAPQQGIINRAEKEKKFCY